MRDQKPLQMNKKYPSVVANDIIRGRQKMTLREMQLLQLVISQVVKEDNEFATYTTTVTELAKFLGIHQRSLYRDLDKITDLLQSRFIKIKVDGKYVKFNWINKSVYDPETKVLTLQLHDDLKPYLIALEKFYTNIKIEKLLSFKSYYAIRLYQLVVCNWGEKEQSQYNMTIDEIRDFFQAYDKYKLNRDLVKKTIKPALDELNMSDYCIVLNYEEHYAHTKGSPIESVSFEIRLFDDIKEKQSYITSTPRVKELFFRATPIGKKMLLESSNEQRGGDRQKG